MRISYDKYDKLIRERAWSFHKSFGVPVEDLYLEGVLAFYQKMPLWQPGRAKRSTFIYVIVTRHLLNFCRNWNNQIINTEGEFEENFYSCQEDFNKSVEFKSSIAALSAEAQGVIGILFECPNELLKLAKNDSPRAIRGALYKYLRNLGWKWNSIWSAFDEIKLVVSEF